MKRKVFFVSDRTGITAEMFGQSLLSQFEETEFDETTLPFIDTLIKALEQQTLAQLVSPTQYTLTDKNSPTAPLQPWFLDGFFKVHLDHYLYINANFNIVEKSLTDSDKFQLVNFKQSRRVITGEIHYFDHPYIGMIVQIRRFDPSKPTDEAVSQAIK